MDFGRFPRNGLLFLILPLFSAVFAAPPPAGNYHLLNKYGFGPAAGSTTEYFDYINVDSPARRVYLSLSDGTLAQVTIFDLKTLKVLDVAKSDPDTDCIVYDPVSKRVFTMNGDSHSSTVVDAKTGAVIKTLNLAGSPEFAVADGKGMIYADLSKENQVIAIDSRTLEVKSRWPTAPSGGSTALAMDREHRRLFSAGRKPQILVVMDADNGNIIQSFPITAGTDAAAYDPATKTIFVSTREGNIHIFHEDSPNKFSIVETVKTEFGAKTMGLDIKTHRLFLDTSDFGPIPLPTPERPNPQAPAVLGTFRVLVYGP